MPFVLPARSLSTPPTEPTSTCYFKPAFQDSAPRRGEGVRGSCSAGASRPEAGTPSAGVLTHVQRRELGNSAGWGSFLPPRVSPALGSFHWSALRDSKMKMVFPP